MEYIIPCVKSVNCEFENIRILEPKIWEDFPRDIKKEEFVDILITTIKKWKLDTFPCRLCKTYLQNIDYLWK